MSTDLSRRDLFRQAVPTAAGLAIAFSVPTVARAAAKKAPAHPLPPPNAFLRIDPDETVTVVLAHSEMGQGIWTGLAMLIAEELECDWSKVRSEHAIAAPVYGHPMMGIQMTGGSSSTNGELDRYRTVGALAKDMLVRAAAAKWKVSPASCTAANGVVTHGSSSLTYGQLTEAANKLEPADHVKLKDPKDWKLLGTKVRRLDTPAKIDGTAQFGMDVHFEGLRTATVARAPQFGAKVSKLDASAALEVPGVEQVVQVPSGVAVIAKHFWAAKLGRDALKVEWTGGATADSAKIVAEFRELAQKPGPIAEEAGKVDDAMAKAAKTYLVEYDVPYLAHAPMEPLNCAVKITGDEVEIWTGSQMQTVDQAVAAKIAGTKPEKVKLHTLFLGGGFGRRANPNSDFVGEAVAVAKAAGVPVKVVWTRDDDIRGGYYRPAYVHRIKVGTDASGAPIAWDHTIVGQSILAGTPFEAFAVKHGIDETSTEGVSKSPYLEGVGARRISLHSPKPGIPVLWWRSVGNTHTAFAMECMLDELAHAAGADPLAYRLGLLKDKPRHAGALKLAAEKAGWDKPLPAGRARGLAVHESFGSIVAEVATVSIDDRKRIHVHEVIAAVDCGTAVNPLGLEAQVQGSIAFGLSATLHSKLTLTGGAVVESNFHDYQVLRMHEMPKVEVHVIQSGAPMGGIGEPSTAPVAPAVANAVFALTKQRLRSLPLVVA